MAILVNNAASGNWSSSSTWLTVDSSTWTQTTSGQESSTTSIGAAGTSTGTFSLTSGTVVTGALIKFAYRSSSALSGTVRLDLKQGASVVASSALFSATLLNELSVNTGSSSWVYVKLTAPYTIGGGGGNLTLVLTHSVGSGIYVTTRTTPATGFTFGIVTATTATPAAGDQIVIAPNIDGTGAFTATTTTIDSASVTVGASVTGTAALEIGYKATLAHACAASTAYTLTLNGNLIVSQYGVLNLGTIASPLPDTSTLALTFNCTSANQYGAIFRGYATISMVGATKTHRAWLASNVSAAATSITTDTTTNWLSGDLIGIATTNGTPTQSETVTLSANATGTTVPVSALGFAHTGSVTPYTVRAEVINLTRNLKVSGASVTLTATFGGTTAMTGSLTAENVEFFWLGNFQFTESFTPYVGVRSITNCSLSRSVALTFNLGNCATASLTNCVGFNSGFQFGQGVYTGTDLTAMLSKSTGTCFTIGADSTVNLTTIFGIGGAYCSQVTTGSTSNAQSITVNGVIFHGNYSTSGYGFYLSNNDQNETYEPTLKISNAYIFHTTYGIAGTSGASFSVRTGVIEGNDVGIYGFTRILNATFSDLVLRSATGFTQRLGFNPSTGAALANVAFDNCTFGQTGFLHSTNDVQLNQSPRVGTVAFRNCKFTATNPFNTFAPYGIDAQMAFYAYNQTVNDNRLYRVGGSIRQDFTFNQIGAGQGQRMMPTSTTWPLCTPTKTIPVPAGKRAIVSVYARKSVAGDGTAYGGSEVSLCSRANYYAGTTSDSVLATTTSASIGAWERVSGQTSVMSSDTMLEVYARCAFVSGSTSGWVTLDNWTVEIV